jgi:hypothetical protein
MHCHCHGFDFRIATIYERRRKRLIIVAEQESENFVMRQFDDDLIFDCDVSEFEGVISVHLGFD